MNELKRIVENIQSVWTLSSYPQDFLDAYDQMECLATHAGRETFLVRRKQDGIMAVAKCYDREKFPCQPQFDLLRSISHPGVPRFFEQYQNQEMLCVVREYIEGEPLSEYALERDLPLERILAIGRELCGILSALHSHHPPVIHRDIKPENVIVKPDGGIALIDFDIARAYKSDAERDTVFFGTRGFAPPEQYGFDQTDCRTDIYAFGVLLRYLVTGSVKKNANISFDPRLEAVIERCTSFSPKDRYGDIRAVQKDLDRINASRFPIRWPRLLTKLLALAAALCLGFSAGRYTDWLRPAPVISFSEPLMERAVRLQLGKETGLLTMEELAQVKRIYIYGSEAYGDPDAYYAQRVDNHKEGPIRTLDDVKLLPHLEEIHMVRQGYVDISAIAELPEIVVVELKHMRISGVQPIAHVPGVRGAILFDCGLFDVTALESCPWLETLDVGRNNLTDLKQIGFHPSVRSLDFKWLKMNSLDGIADRFPRLRTIALQYGEIKDMSALKTLSELEKVYVLKSQAEFVKELLRDTTVEVIVAE